MSIKITISENIVILSSPYHPDLPKAAKNLGGKFQPSTKNWEFDVRDYDRVHELARKIYGNDGNTPTELVTVEMHLSGRSYEKEIWKYGRLICKRPGRDHQVQLGDGVIIVTGEFERRGGSMKYPTIGPTNVVLHVRDVPRDLLDTKDVLVPEEPITILNNPFESYSDEDLIAELQARGYQIT